MVSVADTGVDAGTGVGVVAVSSETYIGSPNSNSAIPRISLSHTVELLLVSSKLRAPIVPQAIMLL